MSHSNDGLPYEDEVGSGDDVLPLESELLDHVDEGHELAPEDEFLPEGVREYYPGFLTLLLAGAMACPVIVTNRLFPLPPWAFAVSAVVIFTVALLWRRDSNKTLRDRMPPPGWKSDIEPDRMEKMSLAEFNGMRFELSGDDDDDLEDHQVRWVTRYSKDIVGLSKGLMALSCLCIAGSFLWPTLSIPGSGAELSHDVGIRVVWLFVSLIMTLVALDKYLNWDYGRLMVTNSYFYDLKENPAWFPWAPGKNNPYPMSYVWSADPVDTGWGKLWGHGTVIITIQQGPGNVRELVFKRVPKHREFCNAVNSMAMEQRSPGDMAY